MSETRHCFHIRLLLYYLQAEPRKRTVTDAAHFLGKSKVAVSRALSELEKQGFVERAASRKTVLSAYGGKVAEEYRRKLGIAQTYLQSLDLPPLQAKEDAMAAITTGFSEEYFKRMEERQQHMQIKENFAGRQSFSGSELCEQLDDGSYTLPFVIYREHIQHGNMISMGNRGFEHPCELIVKNHVGMLYLTIATVRARSAQSGAILEGRVQGLQYQMGDSFFPAGQEGRYVYFPVSALHFVSMGRGREQILHGSVCMKMHCNAGTLHMPESTAVFTVMIC